MRLHVREVGEGPPVLLINGLGAHTEMWQHLEQALPGRRLIEFDAPGVGRSPAPRYPVTIPALARLAREVLDSARVDQVDVLGYSMGGLVTQQLAASAPDRVRRLVLVGTSCGLWGGVPGQLGPLLNLATPLRYWSPAFYRRTIGGLAGGRARFDADWVAQHGQLRRRQPPSTRGYLGQVLSASQWSGLPLLHRIHHPVLVVTGDDDPLMPAANAVLLGRRLPNARVLIPRGEGHLLLMDPDSTALRPIRDFLLAETLDEAPVWRDALIVDDEDLRLAMSRTPRPAQPWATASAVMRAVWPAPRPPHQ
ncbi:alpha/beta fold hydrolase [Geodermatophilus sp. URMC 63]